MMYVVLLRAQKLANAVSACIAAVVLNRFPEKIRGRNTMRFLYHCFGLSSLMMCFSIVSFCLLLCYYMFRSFDKFLNYLSSC